MLCKDYPKQEFLSSKRPFTRVLGLLPGLEKQKQTHVCCSEQGGLPYFGTWSFPHAVLKDGAHQEIFGHELSSFGSNMCHSLSCHLVPVYYCFYVGKSLAAEHWACGHSSGVQ